MRIFLAICASLTVLSACTATGSITPNPSPSKNPSSTPSPTASASSSTTATGTFAVTATPEAYTAWLTCMGEKHPGAGFLALVSPVTTVYAKNWAVYRSQADNSVKINSDQYGKECGA